MASIVCPQCERKFPGNAATWVNGSGRWGSNGSAGSGMVSSNSPPSYWTSGIFGTGIGIGAGGGVGKR
jgi:hypothetical protein